MKEIQTATIIFQNKQLVDNLFLFKEKIENELDSSHSTSLSAPGFKKMREAEGWGHPLAFVPLTHLSSVRLVDAGTNTKRQNERISLRSDL